MKDNEGQGRLQEGKREDRVAAMRTKVAEAAGIWMGERTMKDIVPRGIIRLDIDDPGHQMMIWYR
jgi:hypothetical protein